MSTATFEINNLEALAWCKKKHAEDRTLNMHWDGGGDSGWVDFQIDGAITDEDQAFIDFLTDKCYSELDYGSWAGEFSASGDATFNPEEGAFVGTDYYSEDGSIDYKCELKIDVPKNVWFDAVEIMIEDEEIEVSVDLIVRNGFKTEAHQNAENSMTTSIKNQVSEIVEEYINYNSSPQSFRSMWEEINLSKSDFLETEAGMSATLNSISIGVFDEEQKDIYISLNEEE